MGEVVELIKGDTPVICSQERAQYYLDKGFQIVGDETDENAEELPVEEPKQDDKELLAEVLERAELPGTIDRQGAITIAVQRIFDRKDSSDFTDGGLPRVEVIATEAGVKGITRQERAIAMESIDK